MLDGWMAIAYCWLVVTFEITRFASIAKEEREDKSRAATALATVPSSLDFSTRGSSSFCFEYPHHELCRCSLSLGGDCEFG
jgi:hypothetical protein